MGMEGVLPTISLAAWHKPCSSASETNRPERAMPTTITVMYENVDDATFDLDCYMAKHMPLVDAKFKPFGIKGMACA